MANSLAHTKWLCKYHIVFTPKYRRKVIYNSIKADIREIIRNLCKWKGVEILEGHLMPDHIHMLVVIPPKYSVSQFMGYLKGKSAMLIYERHANEANFTYADGHIESAPDYEQLKNDSKIDYVLSNEGGIIVLP